jgi:hypothetical protein
LISSDLVITLTVAYVASGGNIRKGRYFYSFDPDVIVVTDSQTNITFALDNESGQEFVIRDLVSSDSKEQLSQPKSSGDFRSISVVDENTQRQLIYLSILVYDTKRQELIACDPQVINSPESESGSSVSKQHQG